MKALILVDLQNDFCPGGALEVRDGDQVIAVANRLATVFDLVVATQDWHPADHGSFADSHPGNAAYELIDLNGLEQVLWPAHCVQGSQGAAFHRELSVVQHVFQKGTDASVDSYSGFFDNGRRKATGLGPFLRERAVDAVYVLGLATDYCVKFTALDAVAEGFQTHLVLDACRGVGLGAIDIDDAVAEMRKAGVAIVQSADLL